MSWDHKSIVQRIASETSDPKQIQNDCEMIALANQKSWHDNGWEQLQNRCYTQEARNMIAQIERRKYRSIERHSDML